MNNDTLFYTYILLDTRKPKKYKIPCLDIILPYEPFYVGKGKDYRKNNHLSEVLGNWDNEEFFNGKSSHKKRKIRNILKAGFEPLVYVIKNNVSESESFMCERFLIRMIGRSDLRKGVLVNKTNGGEGVSGFKHPEELRKRHSERQKGKISPMKGKTHSPETRLKLSVSRKGKPSITKGRKVPVDIIKKQVNTFKINRSLGLHNSKKGKPSGYKSTRSIPIVVINPYSFEYKEYDTIKEYLRIVENDENNNSKRNHIANVCKGITFHYQFNIIMYLKDYNEENLKSRIAKYKASRKGRIYSKGLNEQSIKTA